MNKNKILILVIVILNFLPVCGMEYESKIEEQIKLLKKPEIFLNNLEKKDPDKKVKLITKYKNLKANKLSQENYQEGYSALEFYKELENHAITLSLHKINLDLREKCPNVEFTTDFKFGNQNRIWKTNFEYIFEFCKHRQKNPKNCSIDDIFLRTHALEIVVFLNNLGYMLPSFLENKDTDLAEIYNEDIIKKIAYKYFIESFRVLLKEIYDLEINLITYKNILSNKEIYDNFIEIYNSLKETYYIKDQFIRKAFYDIMEIIEENYKNDPHYYRTFAKDQEFKEKLISHCALNSKTYTPLLESFCSIKLQEFYINKLKNPENLKTLFKSNFENILKLEKLLEDIKIKNINDYLNKKDQEVINKELERKSDCTVA